MENTSYLYKFIHVLCLNETSEIYLTFQYNLHEVQLLHWSHFPTVVVLRITRECYKLRLLLIPVHIKSVYGLHKLSLTRRSDTVRRRRMSKFGTSAHEYYTTIQFTNNLQSLRQQWQRTVLAASNRVKERTNDLQSRELK